MKQKQSSGGGSSAKAENTKQHAGHLRHLLHLANQERERRLRRGLPAKKA